MEGKSVGGHHLVSATPNSPTFVVDGNVWSRCELGARVDQGPVLLRQRVHFAIEGGQATMRVLGLPVLVAINMLGCPLNRGFLQGLPNGLDQVQILLAALG